MLSCQKAGFLIVTTLLAVGCGERSKLKVGASCLLNSDCNSPLVCTMGKCHEGCKETRDCPAGQSCMLTNGDGICQLPAESDCTTSACLGGWVCAADLRCHTGCLSATNCTKGQTCVDGVCADLAQLVNGELPQRAPSDAGIDLGGPTRDDGGAGKLR